MNFSKYQALGNDYLVGERRDVPPGFGPDLVRRMCDRHFGVGSDGLLLREPATGAGPVRLTIFNPDGSEAEKSGNGLRIFARYLWDRGDVGDEPFRVDTPGGPVACRVGSRGREVTVDMGAVSFDSRLIPVAGEAREVLREDMTIDGETVTYSAATIGNPHCVILRDKVSREEALRLGPRIEVEPRFVNKTNVQFVEVLDEANLRIEIWERAAGYTLASGSSSSAAAAVTHRLGLCGPSVTMHMPGGQLAIEIREGFEIRMSGPVAKVADGVLADELVEGPGD